MKKPSLKKLYNSDPAAKKFLEDNPEFNDRFIEQCEVNHPGFADEGSYRLTETPKDADDYSAMLAEAIRLMPASPYKTLLKYYYEDNWSTQRLMTFYGLKKRSDLYNRIQRAKKSALASLTVSNKRAKELFGVIDTKVIKRGAEERTLYKLLTVGWTLEDGTVLPNAIQEILNEEPEFADWEAIFLKT